ncbi:hypothetical protein [Microbulbifer variabilis]|uniref:hypothetical protein n=1 Tax=Microbulbifer variabilis TaxID=266805 RepID=UPI001CFD9CEC|nr:hypothetical protein [Microbulbifer variabilis]
MSTKDYNQQLNRLAELIWENEADASFKENRETPPELPPVKYPSEVLWGKWGGHYIVIVRYISGRKVTNIKKPEKYPDEASGSAAALNIIRAYPKAAIRYLPSHELAIYLL